MSAPDSSLDSANAPDVMNDPAFDPGAGARPKKSVDDPDTCRICRAEASTDEPLFYPCKCSGSIKFVHQDCLMEWLSHSQKKYCELCKTPFRFTKLYHPQMPSTVPTLVFLRQVIVHTWRSLAAWSRMHLVVFVWLGWLPWSMRTVWRGLFWIGDGGWINWVQMEEEALTAARGRMDKLAAEGTTPIPQKFFLSAEYTASVVMSRLADAFPQMASPTLNLTKGEPVVFGLARSILRGIIGWRQGDNTAPIPQSSMLNASHTPSPPYRSSWLSDIGFLRSLTRWPLVNNVIIDTMEGQLITLFIVIAFILVFLIREWVVQQQPAADLPGGNEANRPILAIQNGNQPPDAVPEGAGDAQENANEIVAASDHGDTQGLHTPDEAAPQEEQVVSTAEDSSGSVAEDNGLSKNSESVRESADSQEDPAGPSHTPKAQQRPGMPDRGHLARAAEIRRTIEEQTRVSGREWPGVKIFMDLWTRADNRPMEVLRIIEEEGRGEELDWVIAAMRRLENIPISPEDPVHFRELPTAGETAYESDDAPSTVRALEADITVRDQAVPVSEQEHDITNGLDGKHSFDGVLTAAEQGFPALTIVTGEDHQGNEEDEPGSKTAEPTQIEAFSEIQPVGQSLDSETASAPRPLDAATHVASNSFHPDYAGPLPPYPRDDPTTRQPPPAANAENVTLNTVAPDASTQAVGNRPTSTGGGSNQSFAERMMTWLWGEATPTQGENNGQAATDDEHVVQDLANEAPFVPIEHGQPILDDRHHHGGNNDAQGLAEDPEVPGDAIQAGLDPNDAEVAEEVEDLEGVMELVGMQGPIAGLIQNGMFCAVLIALTIFLAVWIPYIMGKLFLVVLTHPVSLLLRMPLRWMASLADLLSDTFVFSVFCAYYWVTTVIHFLCSPLRRFRIISHLLYGEEILAEAAKGYAENSLGRLTDAFVVSTGALSESDIPTFSIIAHESLKMIQHRLATSLQALVLAAITICTWDPTQRANESKLITYLTDFQSHRALVAEVISKSATLLDIANAKVHDALAWVAALRHLDLLRVDMSIPQRTRPLDFTLAYWDTKDRTLAILCGYLFFALLGVLYLRLSRALQSKNKGGNVDGLLADVLYQAGGVTKVILIISIEMIVFPLYCGLLLDVALLPLFRNVTLLSRLEFMVNSPCTSLFVHWFVGTCYMFHFALFVSMCRKIMRTGVLYFIRDPDDPTFHPVRDVLERSVFTQLCKIAFSALVYGGLVIVCMGSVVWGLSTALDGVFPIHWSSNEPVLEFPVDLLFYNFLMPLAMRLFRPADGLTKMYGWWFRKCARGLRLSHFLFGERREDEEGRHVQCTWKDFFSGKQGDVKNPVIGNDRQQLADDRGLKAYFLRDGRYVRTPASDQVRIPKGVHTFVEVDEAGNRVDGQPDNDRGLHGRNNELFSTVYIPPRFRLRISAFIILLWLFAAATGVCITIVPLAFGRHVFSNIFPSHPRMNDIYAFSIGISILGSAAYVLVNARRIFHHIRHHFIPNRKYGATRFFDRAVYYAARLARILYTYTAFAFLLPSLLAMVTELYFFIPLHTYFGSNTADYHVIYVMQDWTLGVLYMKLIGRLILWNAPSRPATALRNIVQAGWTDPDVRLATRGFILPATLLLSTLLVAPLGLGWLVNSCIPTAGDEAFKSAVYRYSYPGLLSLGVDAVILRYTAKVFQGWKRRIRDEVYLIGERLHNFGERRTMAATRVGM
ncbi:MAG: hypothetical protein Q9201_004467 [Fulgogasparrea decipioides]